MQNQSSAKNTNWGQFGTLIMAFFFWGFVAASNDILIPVFKENLHLSQVESQLVSFAFYIAYTVGSLIFWIISEIRKKDPLQEIGYKNGIILGLVISALGTLLFYPAAEKSSFPLFISGLFVVGLGFALQQIAANPLAIIMGDPKTGSQRLSLAGGINNFGDTIGPLIISFAIFGSVSATNTTASIQSIKIPYLILGAAFLLVAVIFKFSKVPNKIDLDEVAEEEADSDNKIAHHKSVFSYPQLVLGMVAIFVYVGIEVATASNLPEFLREHLHITTDKIAPFVSLYWASLMIGRWTSSVGAFNLSNGAKGVLRFLMPYIGFAVFLLVNKIAGRDVTPFYFYAVIIIALIICDILSKGNPARQLLILSGMGILVLIIGMASSGMVSAYAFMSVGLFCSTIWPCIFTLGVAGLGRYTNKGSSMLIMMIMGGGWISLAQGWLASPKLLGIQLSYILPVCCFVYLAFYAWKVKSILKDQGIDYDIKVTGGGH